LSYITKNEKSEAEFVQAALKACPENTSDREFLATIGRSIIKNRQVSKQEAMFLSTGLPLFMSSTASVFLPAFLPSERQKYTKTKVILDALERGSLEVLSHSLLDYYVARPRGDIWDQMTLFQFCAWFTKTTRVCEGEDDEFEEEEENLEMTSELLNNPKWKQQHNQPPFLSVRFLMGLLLNF
jgi:hypothetical protein